MAAMRRSTLHHSTLVGILAGILFFAVFSMSGCNDDATQPGPSGDHATAPQVQGPASAQHVLHANASPPVPCEGCHVVMEGEYQPPKSWKCVECHKDQTLQLHAATSIENPVRECASCHDFSSASKEATSCASCHSKELPGSGLAVIEPHDPKHPDEDCASCHRAHKTPSLESTVCKTCHNSEKVSGHDKPGIQITGCASCHGYHEKATTASTRCTNCHRQSRAAVPTTATFEGGHEKCASCHKAHRFFKAEVAKCSDGCHLGVVAISQDKVANHQGCIGCHNNHDVKNSPQTACYECHKDIVPKHPKDKKSGTLCIGCHKPHAGSRAPLAVACSSCHTQANSDQGFHQGAGQNGPVCRSCHKPHAFNLSGRGPALCLSCHGPRPFKNARTVRPATKHQNCVQCHQQTVNHQPSGEKVECATCHEDKPILANRGHQKCVGCHEPHSGEQRKACGSCHEDKAGLVNKGHQKCVNCHEPHSGKFKTACGSCHKFELSTAPKDHKQCRNCHEEPHAAKVKKTCASCHTDRTTGVHEKVPGGCRSCHRPHGPLAPTSRPACTSCHVQSRLPALHQNPNHSECTQCHRSHGPQPGRQPAICLACHTDRVNHQPAAKVCFGCHIFRGNL